MAAESRLGERGEPPDGQLVGFVNVAWDGADHAILLDTKTRGLAAPRHRDRGGRRPLVMRRRRGVKWLHVDFERALAPFYFDACGFRPTDGGLIHLATLE